MENNIPFSSRYFENRACEYYPCHSGMEHMNCLFCYCPFYFIDNCPGSPIFKQKKDAIIKSCIDCSFPHDPANFDEIRERIGKELIERF